MSQASAVGTLEQQLVALSSEVEWLRMRGPTSIASGGGDGKGMANQLREIEEASRLAAEARASIGRLNMLLHHLETSERSAPLSRHEIHELVPRTDDLSTLDAATLDALFEAVEDSLEHSAAATERMVAEAQVWRADVEARARRIDELQRETAMKLDALIRG